MLFAPCRLLGPVFLSLSDPMAKARLSSKNQTREDARVLPLSKVKEARDNIVPEVRRVCSWDASKHIPKSSFAVMSLAIVVELYCGNSQEKVLVLDSLVFTNIRATPLPLTSCKWYRNRISLIAVTFHKDRLPALDKILKVVLLRWFPCNFPHMGPKNPDALKCA